MKGLRKGIIRMQRLHKGLCIRGKLSKKEFEDKGRDMR